MIDIHAHIIPKVDDGSISADCTRSQVFSEKTQGVTAIFATPHSENFLRDPQKARSRFQKMQDALGIYMDFYLGCEILCTRDAMPGILDALDDGTLPSMNGTRYVLTEFSPYDTLENALYCLNSLWADGWIPIIAHAERYPFLDPENDVPALTKKGFLIQVNVYALEEYVDTRDLPSRDRARYLIQNRLVSFLGTDTHTMYFRPPSIEQGMLWLQKVCDGDYLEAICQGNAKRLLLSRRVTEDFSALLADMYEEDHILEGL